VAGTNRSRSDLFYYMYFRGGSRIWEIVRQIWERRYTSEIHEVPVVSLDDEVTQMLTTFC